MTFHLKIEISLYFSLFFPCLGGPLERAKLEASLDWSFEPQIHRDSWRIRRNYCDSNLHFEPNQKAPIVYGISKGRK